MKLLDAVERLGEKCKSSVFSKELDVTLNSNPETEGSHVTFRAVGSGSFKPFKLAASAAIVAAGTVIARRLKNDK